MRIWWVAVALLVPVLAGCIAESPPAPAAAPAVGPSDPTAPALSIAWDPVPPVPREAVRFTLHGDGDLQVRHASWSFGDGTSSQGIDATHAYRDAGDFEVVATVQGSDGWTAQVRADVTIVPPEGSAPDDTPAEQDEGTDDPSDPGDDEADGNQTAANEDQNSTGPDEHGYHGFDGEPDDCSRLAPPGPFAVSPEAVTGYEMRVLDIVVLVDSSFQRVHGESWPEVVDTIIEIGDEVYQRDLQLDIEAIAVFPIPTSYLDLQDTNHVGTTGPAAEESNRVLEQSRRYMDDQHPDLDRDLVYTFVGASIAGSIAGQAECIGGARYKDAAYGWGEADALDDGNLVGPAGWFRYSGVKVILHEMAHILGAHHHYQECGVPYAASAPEDLLGACSIMTNVVDFASFQFSTLNKMAIRSYVEEVDL